MAGAGDRRECEGAKAGLCGLSDGNGSAKGERTSGWDGRGDIGATVPRFSLRLAAGTARAASAAGERDEAPSSVVRCQGECDDE